MYGSLKAVSKWISLLHLSALTNALTIQRTRTPGMVDS